MRSKIVAAVLCALMGLVRIASAQSSLPLQLQTQVQPAFRITPMAHSFEAPRGKLIDFEFDIESLERPTSLRILAVGLRQQENGVIMPDETASPADVIRLLSPSTVELDSNEKSKIRGQIRVPRSNSKFHSFGILVKDLGRAVNRDARRDSGKARVAINFVTQYLLRCDISIIGAPGGDVRRLQILSGQLVEFQGDPKARVWISNPTDSFLEFEVRCRIAIPQSHAKRSPFSLVLPVRASIEGPERHTARILPGSRVRLEEFLPEPILPGAYELEIELLTRGRRQLQAQFPVVVRGDEFPAQRSSVVAVAPHISVRPAQVELSLRRKGQRYLAMTFVNDSQNDVEVHLNTQNGESSSDEWLLVRPAAFTLASCSTRKALVSISNSRVLRTNRFGAINANVRLANGQIRTQTLPVAVLTRVEDVPKLSIGTLRWDADGAKPGFVAPVTNEGDVHLPLDGRLSVSNALGQSAEFLAGYGRWLLPGRSDDLRFRLPGPLPPGAYRYRMEIKIGEGRTPVTVEDDFRIEAKAELTVEDAAL